MPFFEPSDNIRIHYEETGSGPAMLFIHGWAMSGRVWRFQAEALGSGFRVITLDLRGHGLSSATDSSELQTLASDVTALCNYLDLNGVTLVGWSLGAQVALTCAAALQQRPAGLVLVGGTPKFTASAEFPPGLPKVEVRTMGLRLKRDYLKTMGEFFRAMFAPEELSPDCYQRIVHDIIMGGRLAEPVTALRELDVLDRSDLRHLLPTINVPTLLIHGSADTICLPDASRFMHKELPDASLCLLPGIGHAPFLSRAEEFNALVRGFVSSCEQKNQGS